MNAPASKVRHRGDDPRLDAIDDRIRPLSPSRLGFLLQELRQSKQLALRDVALVPELRSELEDFESGRRRPDAYIIAALLDTYGADLDRLVPPRKTLVVTEGSDHEVLTRYLAAVRRGRSSPKDPLLRAADLEVLAEILGSDPKEIRRRLRTHAIEERIAALSPARMGVLVHKLRTSARFSRRLAGTPSAAIESKLEEVEAGRVRPDAAIVEALLDYFDAGLDDLVPPRQTLVITGGTDKEVLTRYLAAMRRWRGRTKNPPLRRADLDVLAGILGTDPTDIERQLRKLTGCSRRRAKQLSALVVAGLAVAPAASALHHHSSAAPATAAVQTQALHSSDIKLISTPGTAAHHTSTATTAAHATTVQRATAAPKTAAVHSVAADCATAMAYLTKHAKPGFAHYCRPGNLKVGITNAVAYTCVPGANFKCPDGHKEIIIADPACAITYENEASNSYWNFSTGAVIHPGSVQDGRTWDPYGECT